MSEILYDMLMSEYPPHRKGANKITTYPYHDRSDWIERIHCDLTEKIFLDIWEVAEKDVILVKAEELETIANNVFTDIDFEFMPHIPDEGTTIQFEPQGIDDYQKKHNGHFITIRDPLRMPKITISTGNRGSIELNEKQRLTYFRFVNDVYNLFMEKAKKKIEK